ncbi:hypothetical protein LguiA_007379 [Lonicera macranthoides]
MSIASSQQSFLANALISTSKPSWNKKIPIPLNSTTTRISCCRFQSDDHKPKDKDSDSPSKRENKFAKLALAALAAGVLTLGSFDPASAAKSGGRVGGQAFKSPSPGRSSSSSPRINNSRTNVYINPPVAPPLVGGYGYYGGWGWSPFSYFAPGPGVAVSIGGGFDTLVFFMLLGAGAAVVRKFFGSREDDDDDY